MLYICLIILLLSSAVVAQIGPITETITNVLVNETWDNANDGASGEWLRVAHVKQHGCVRAFVTPLSGLPTNLAKGVFAQNVTYPAFIRFSNSIGRAFFPMGNPMDYNASDAKPDVRGMAFKLFNVTEKFLIPNVDTQTFTFTTANTAFIDNQVNGQAFFEAVQGGILDLNLWFGKHPHLTLLYFASSGTGVVPDLLSTNWWQAAPQSHGVNQWCKYHVYPCTSERQTSKLGNIGPFDFDYYREKLVQDLSEGAACMKWAVQFYANEQTTPINDSTVEWKTPFYDIAQVEIPQQAWGTPGQEAFCASMSFNPASTIAEHQIVGETQIIRTSVYQALGQLRRKLSNQSTNDATYEDWLNYPNM